MNKEQFLRELNTKLKYLPETDRNDAIRFYDEYISVKQNIKTMQLRRKER